jgi:tetratricopeptide (TPR) repeat protein
MMDIERLKAEERKLRNTGDSAGLANCLGNQAIIFNTNGNFDAALLALKEAEKLCRSSNPRELPRCLAFKGIVLRKKGEIVPALTALREATALFLELGSAPDVVRTIMNTAMILAEDLSLPNEALELTQGAHRIATEARLPDLIQRTQNAMLLIKAGVI